MKSKKTSQPTIFHTEKEKDIFAPALSYFHPHAEILTSYDDNIYQIHKKRGDVHTRVTPGVQFLLGNNRMSPEGRPRTYLELDGGYDIHYYYATDSNYNMPYVDFFARWVGPHYRVSLRNDFKNEITPTSQLSRGISGFTGRARNFTQANFSVDYKRTTLETGYTRYEYSYGAPFKSTSDYVDQKINITGLVNPSFTPKTFFLFEYDFGVYEYTNKSTDDTNYKYHQLWGGIRGKITKKISGDLRFGYEMRNSYLALTKFKDSVNIRIDLRYRYSPKTTLRMYAAKESRPSITVGAGRSDGYRAGVNFIHFYGSRLRMDLALKYGRDIYTDELNEDTYSGSAKFEYQLNKWIVAALEYLYVQRDSERANSKYRDNVITLSIGAKI
ncbi:MAG: outer membrane beta-barrel protein [Candidatus Omnitrophica bacterium]|nr:outer membrane beta-barrel protein [Candidatus Omnitrophota bacterium]